MRNLLAAALLLALVAGCGKKEEPVMPEAKPSTVAPTVSPDVGRAKPSDEATAKLLASLPAPYNTADLLNGQRQSALCRSCHTFTEGGPDLTGPNLHGVFGRKAGSKPGYTYSAAVKAAGFNWDAAKLDQWLTNPKGFLPGTKMTFLGIRDERDRIDLIAFLKVQTGYQPAAKP
jgi:cytochrome c